MTLDVDLMAWPTRLRAPTTHLEGSVETDPDEQIKAVAYKLWEDEGRQHGMDQHYWFRARQMITKSDTPDVEDEELTKRGKRRLSFGSKGKAETARSVEPAAAARELPPAPEPIVAAIEVFPPPPIPPLALSERYLFNVAETRTWLHDIGGMSVAERNHRWTLGPRATFTVYLPATCPEGLALRLETRGLVAASAPVIEADLLIGGGKVATLRYGLEDEPHPTIVEAEIPAAVVKPSGPVTVELHIPHPRRPVDLGKTSDTRNLGFSLIAVTLLPR